jgi:hypothetical protein
MKKNKFENVYFEIQKMYFAFSFCKMRELICVPYGLPYETDENERGDLFSESK